MRASYFSEEIRLLKRGENLPKPNHHRHLMPYFDEDELLRRGGRLLNSLMDEDSKHPIILP